MCKSLEIITKDNVMVVSSRVIALDFDKRHSDVIRSIETSISLNAKLRSADFFIETQYKDKSGKRSKEYLLTKDGFSLIVMGFTGEKALEWKLKYIEAFNKMENYIKAKESSEWQLSRKNGKLFRRKETDNLKKLAEYAISQGSKTYSKSPGKIYINYSNLVNSMCGIKSGQRDICTWKVLITIQTMEDMISNTVVELMEDGAYYKDIYKECKRRCKEILKYAYLPEQKLLK